MTLRRTHKLGQLLLDEGLVREEDLRRALESQGKDCTKRLGEQLIDMGVLSPKAMLSALARQLNVKACQLRHGLIDPAAARLLDREEAVRLKALPLFCVQRVLTVAMAEPQSLPTIDRLSALTGCRINPVLALERNIAEFQDKYLGDQVDIHSFLTTLTESEVTVVERETVDEDANHEIGKLVEGSPIINLVNLAIMTAIRDGASDIHIEPTKQVTRLRYRIDGNLRELMSAPTSMHAAIVSRVKVIGKMDIAERRLPQEGRVHVVAEGREIDLRVSSMPTLLGEKVVIRILDKTNLQVALEKLGLAEDQLPVFRRIFSRPHGIVLVTGPTGSGKTTTLYSVLDLLSTVEKNIVTIEDPVEYQLNGINQIQVNEAIGLTFARALRSILRQDPDIVMVGEIRDSETARVAIQAALTGHLVLATLHTNNAPGAFLRLTDMGVERYLMASAFNGVIAQRLARTICPYCRTSYYPPESALADAGWAEHRDPQGAMGKAGLATPEARPSGPRRAGSDKPVVAGPPRVFYKGEGCKQCHDSGFRGRAGIFEVLEVTEELRRVVHDAQDEEQIKEVARRHGWRPLREQGLQLVLEERSTLEEVLRVTHAETEQRTRAEDARATASVAAGTGTRLDPRRGRTGSAGGPPGAPQGSGADEPATVEAGGAARAKGVGVSPVHPGGAGVSPAIVGHGTPGPHKGGA